MIWIEGNILSAELLDKLTEQTGQLPHDFGLKKTDRIADEISRCWADAKDLWRIFKRRIENLPDEETGTTETRNIWMVPFLQNLLGYQLQLQRETELIDGLSFSISHRDTHLDSFPVHITGCRQKLDRKYERQRQSAHSLVQDYLNRTEHTYAIITNGLTIRLLRDSARLLKQQFVEWDIQQIIEEDRYTDFAVLFRLIHNTRMPQKQELASESILEQYHQTSIDEGNRIREKLSNAVEKALENLGNGFLSHPSNELLRNQLSEGEISPEDFSRLLRRVVYRLLFLMVSEERELIFPSIEENDASKKEKWNEMKNLRSIYRQNYSINRLRQLSEKMYFVDLQAQNIWSELLVNFSIFENETVSNLFGIGALDGDLFSYNAIEELNNCKLLNHDILEAINMLSVFKNPNGPNSRINYKLLDVEELGSVYESLLDLHPLIESINGTLRFRFVAGMERKTTGSYYTRSDLVQEIIKSALEPVILERLKLERKISVTKEKVGQELLKLKVCDPACGSGHFLLAAARSIARELAKLRSGDEQPTPSNYRECLREVIQHCIYGVDMNPDAVELCKLALWLESHNSGKPLSFLDHKIRCGNSLVGVTDLKVLLQPLPDEAFNPVTGDDKKVCQELKKENAIYRKTKQGTIDFAQAVTGSAHQFSDVYHDLEKIEQNDVAAIKKMKRLYDSLRNNPNSFKNETACNLWTAAFFFNYTEETKQAAPTSERISKFLQNPAAYSPLFSEAIALAAENKFFHWPLEFPDVFEQGGFDVMMGNPPWERIKLQEQEFFATKNPEIAAAPNKSARMRLIKELVEYQPQIFKAFNEALHTTDAQSKFMRGSQRFPLTAVGDINTYSVFSELFCSNIHGKGRVGIIIPTGIATDSSTKDFFEYLIKSERLTVLVGFENEEFLFLNVHHSTKFCCLIATGKDIVNTKIKFTFFNRNFEQVRNSERWFELDKADLLNINPNTKTCPIFRTQKDALLTTRIYNSVPVLINDEKHTNPWQIKFATMFHMANDSHLFKTTKIIHIESSKRIGYSYENKGEIYLPLYEAKMIWQYDHRFGTYENATQANLNAGILPQSTDDDKQKTEFLITPKYYVLQNNVQIQECAKGRKWFLGFREITSAISIRTAIFSIIPLTAVGNKIPLVISEIENSWQIAALVANFNSIVLDYVVRQKIGGISLSYFYVKQLPIIPPTHYSVKDFHFIIPRVIELTYTAWDMKPFADDVWNEADETLRIAIQKQHAENTTSTGGNNYEPPAWLVHNEVVKLSPFKWDENRRAMLKAELDAYYATLYGLTEEELRYILCPQDVYGENFPGETFRVLKEKEIRKFGEYRTKRLVMEAWERMK